MNNKNQIADLAFTASLNLDSKYAKEFENGNFIYLRPKQNGNSSAYDLEIVEHYEVLKFGK